MPNIIPMKDLQNVVAVSQLCHATDEPVFVTKDGYGDMVIMSMSTYERMSYVDSVVHKVEEAERDIAAGRFSDGTGWLDELQAKYAL